MAYLLYLQISLIHLINYGYSGFLCLQRKNEEQEDSVLAQRY
ncbi:hypothetical protein SAMN05216294_1635 [Flagellimonas zhangzhouensis]|uniref:Uncharacterized protein n=1 Tax=Flagellimonas zhangzhouensis TaxID=1073328 RepID=A0A1H2QM15_9FLAO|nr:hypothetical protein SAMN05216294_1635 [Allomuricauda zhangzhouensis]SDW08237.1 hypothetical protein SAMN04487892_0286 [Allomuricauda zhangzhouensis]